MQLQSQYVKPVKNKPKPTPFAFTNWENLPDSANVRLPVMILLYGVSSATIWRGVQRGTIPRPKKLSERCSAWNVGEVRASLAAKTVQS